MVVVITLLTILLAIAVPVYRAQVLYTKESVLRNNLAELRDRIDQYRADKDKYPPNLQALVEAGYLRGIPKDPMAEVSEWQEVMADFNPERPDEEPGIHDVKSTSIEISSDGRPYTEW